MGAFLMIIVVVANIFLYRILGNMGIDESRMHNIANAYYITTNVLQFVIFGIIAMNYKKLPLLSIAWIAIAVIPGGAQIMQKLSKLMVNNIGTPMFLKALTVFLPILMTRFVYTLFFFINSRYLGKDEENN